MQTFKQPSELPQRNSITLMVILMILSLSFSIRASEPIGHEFPKTSPVDLQNGPLERAKPVTRKQLTGAELYSMHCNRCHPERYPTERTSAHWKTITLHMQVRANLPVAQTKIILKYLQENSGR